MAKTYDDPLCCSFCGKSQSQVQRLISGMKKGIYICEYDGYEYVKSVNASCEPVAAYPVYNNDYLASRAGSPWRQGYSLSAIPEPTAGVLLLVGCAAVLLRRRVRCARSVDCSFTPATGCAPVRGSIPRRGGAGIVSFAC